MGTSGLGRSSVSGRKRVPSPAPRTKACVIAGIGLKIRHGRRNRLAWHLVAVEELWPISIVRALLLAHRANLYRAGALSQNEMQGLRAYERAPQDHRRRFQ